MSQLICELDARRKGSLGETEDWWRLLRADDGSLYVEHEWSHTKLKSSASDADSEKVEVDDFLAQDTPSAATAREKLRAYLAENEKA